MNELSIIIAIPAYNNNSAIGNTITPCLNQETEIRYEVLLVKNVGTDETKKVIETYRKRVLLC